MIHYSRYKIPFQYQPRSFCIDISIDPSFSEGEIRLARSQSFIMEVDWPSELFLEDPCEGSHSLSVLRHGTVDIVGHTDHDIGDLFFTDDLCKGIDQVSSRHSPQAKGKRSDGVGESTFSGSIVDGEEYTNDKKYIINYTDCMEILILGYLHTCLN